MRRWPLMTPTRRWNMTKTSNIMTRLLLGGIATLAVATGAEAALFVTYGASGTNTTSLSATSDAIDLGAVFTSLTLDATLGLTLTSAAGTTLSTANEALQTVQGC